MKNGFLKVCTLSPALRVADCAYNTQETIAAMQQAAQDGAALAVFPELGLTGYTCSDLFLQQPLLDAAEQGLPGHSPRKRNARARRRRRLAGPRGRRTL